MKLDRTQISKMIHHVLSYDYDEAGNLHFRRFTESQVKIYGSESQEWVMKAGASAGVTFDFISDTDYIALKMDLKPGSSRNWASFDLYVDGVYTDHQRFHNMNQKLLYFTLPEGGHRITLYFPWSAETVVKEVYLSDGASVTEIEKGAKAIAFGDSITQGYDTEHTSLTWFSKVAAKTGLDFVNQGIGAYYFEEEVVDESLVPYHPAVITIAYGANDYSRYDRKEEFIRRAAAYIKKLTFLFPDTKMLAILPIYRYDYNNRVREMYRDYTFEDSQEILFHIYSEYENIHILKETNIPHIPDVFIDDYLHPNELGFILMAETIAEEIKKILAE